jgi:hypothetical protein
MKGSLNENLLRDIKARTLLILISHRILFSRLSLPRGLPFSLDYLFLFSFADLVVSLVSIARTKSNLEYSLL